MERNANIDIVTSFVRKCGYDEKVVFFKKIRGEEYYELIPNDEEGLTGWPMVAVLGMDKKVRVEIHPDYIDIEE